MNRSRLFPPIDGPPLNAAADGSRADHELRTLVFAPLGHDGRITCEILASAGVLAEHCREADTLSTLVDEGCGTILLAEEGLEATSAAGIVDALRFQAPWSDVPIIIVTSDGRLGEERIRRLGVFGPGANVTLLERPFRPATLISAVDAGLRARRRQYQVRDLLHELQEARDTAERANRAKDEFLAALSHELRTPLNPVLLLASEAAQDPAVPAPLRNDFALIARSIELEAHLIDDLLDLTRISRGKIELDLKCVDLHAALHDALAAIQGELRNRPLTVRLDLHAPRRRVMADRVRLQQVLWNVIKNAVKFTPDHGTVVISTVNPPGATRIQIAVTDTGIGMTAAEINAAFDAFAQGEHAARGGTHRFGGLGLGLAISRKLLELHGGTISAESDGRGHGSTFSILLPLADLAGADPAPVGTATVVRGERGPVDSAPPSRNRAVLLVEDHEPTRTSLTRLLHRRGFAVTPTGSLAEARAAVNMRPFDLLISDLGLPDGNGCELMTSLRDRFDRSIALSGYGMESDIEQSKRAGFCTHLVKPLTVQSLDRALTELFQSPGGA